MNMMMVMIMMNINTLLFYFIKKAIFSRLKSDIFMSKNDIFMSKTDY